LKALLPAGVEVFYAMKANPHAAFLAAAKEGGAAGIEIASLGEGEQALKAGFSPHDLIFTGPGKSAEELIWCVQKQIRAVHIESLTEAHRLNSVCTDSGRTQDILIRVNPNFHLESAQVKFSGDSSKMGIDVEIFRRVLKQIIEMPSLNFRGLHVYAGSGVLKANDLLKNCELVFDLAQEIEEKHKGLVCEVIDFGGGFGVDYEEKGIELSVETYSKGLDELIRRSGFAGRTFILELGRYLASDSGWYCTEIVDIKISLGKTQVICRGGYNHFRRPAAMNINHPIAIVPMDRPKVFDGQESAKKEKVFIGGPLCTTADRLAGQDIYIDHAEIGDIAVFCLAGAYGLTMSHLEFLSHPHPPEIVIHSN
jgi:diaminopimelate decarboxylase